MLKILSLTIQGNNMNANREHGKNMKKTHIIFQYSTQNTPFLRGPSFWCQIRATDHDALHRDQTFDIRGIPKGIHPGTLPHDHGKPKHLSIS